MWVGGEGASVLVERTTIFANKAVGVIVWGTVVWEGSWADILSELQAVKLNPEITIMRMMYDLISSIKRRSFLDAKDIYRVLYKLVLNII